MSSEICAVGNPAECSVLNLNKSLCPSSSVDDSLQVPFSLGINLGIKDETPLLVNGFTRETDHIVNLVLLIDVSGSMQGSKIEHLKRVCDFIGKIRNSKNILISVVTFGQYAKIVYEDEFFKSKGFSVEDFTTPNPSNQSLSSVVNNLYANEDSTNYELGLNLAIQQVKKMDDLHKKFNTSRACVNSILMITDGEPNNGKIHTRHDGVDTTEPFVWTSFKESCQKNHVDMIGCIAVEKLPPQILTKISKCAAKEFVASVKQESDINTALSEYLAHLLYLRYRQINISVVNIVPIDAFCNTRFQVHFSADRVKNSEELVNSTTKICTTSLQLEFPSTSEDLITAYDVHLPLNMIQNSTVCSMVHKCEISFVDLLGKVHTVTYNPSYSEFYVLLDKNTETNIAAACLIEKAKANRMFDQVKEMIFKDQGLVKMALLIVDERLVKLGTFMKIHPESESLLTPLFQKIQKWKQSLLGNKDLSFYLNQNAQELNNAMSLATKKASNLDYNFEKQKAMENMQSNVCKANQSQGVCSSVSSEVEDLIKKYSKGIKCVGNSHLFTAHVPASENLKIDFQEKENGPIISKWVHAVYYNVGFGAGVTRLAKTLQVIHNENLMLKEGIAVFYTLVPIHDVVFLIFEGSESDYSISKLPDLSNDTDLRNSIIKRLTSITITLYEYYEHMLEEIKNQPAEPFDFVVEYLPSRMIMTPTGLNFVFCQKSAYQGSATKMRHRYEHWNAMMGGIQIVEKLSFGFAYWLHFLLIGQEVTSGYFTKLNLQTNKEKIPEFYYQWIDKLFSSGKYQLSELKEFYKKIQ